MNGEEILTEALGEQPPPEEATVYVDTNPAPIRKKKRKLPPRDPSSYRGRNSPPETQTPERRAELTRLAAARLAKAKKTTIPLRLKASLELHEGLVAIAEKLGGAFTVADIAVRAMELGAVKWANELRLKVEPIGDPLRVFEKTPPAASTRTYGQDEQRVRDEIAAEAAARDANRDDAARALHLPGRRRATA